MLIQLILMSALAGSTIFIGGLLAHFFDEHIEEGEKKERIIHILMSFGAGIILSAIALVLVPRGLETLSVTAIALSFSLGAILFMFIDLYLEKKGGQIATLIAMVMDFVPESIALGAVYVSEPSMAMLLAVFIGLQNLPESFNAFRDMVSSGFSATKTLVAFAILSTLGIVSALIGHFMLRHEPIITAHLMTFASGGILYLLTQDIIPESKLNYSHTASLGATLGFLIGIIGEMLV